MILVCSTTWKYFRQNLGGEQVVPRSTMVKLEDVHVHLKEIVPRDISYTLRGLSQVILVNNQVSGLFVVVALYTGGGALLGTLSLVCTFVATTLARRSFVDVDSAKNGLAGYNACLVGCAFPVFVQQEWGVTSFLAGVFCAVVASILNLALKPFGIPTFTFAFNFTIMAYVLFAFDSPGPLPDLPPTAWNILVSPLKGISQIWVVNSALSGLLILIGVAIDSFGIAVYALSGSIVGCATGYMFGGDDALVNTLNGLYGFNSSRMACAIAVFYVPSLASVCFGVGACIFTELLSLGLGQLLLPIPAFTLPFCIAATACHLILSDGALKGVVGAVLPTSPELNFYQHKARLEEEKEERLEVEEIGRCGEPNVMDPTMHVFYGPSAVTIAPKQNNIIDRRPCRGLSSSETQMEESALKHFALHSRPRERSWSLLSKPTEMDDDEVLAALLSRASMVGAPNLSGGSLVLRRFSISAKPMVTTACVKETYDKTDAEADVILSKRDEN
jgi:urea transporter